MGSPSARSMLDLAANIATTEAKQVQVAHVYSLVQVVSLNFRHQPGVPNSPVNGFLQVASPYVAGKAICADIATIETESFASKRSNGSDAQGC